MGGEESDRSPVIYTLARGRKKPRIYASGNVRAGDALGPFHTDPQRPTPTHIYIHTRIANGETSAIFQKKKKFFLPVDDLFCATWKHITYLMRQKTNNRKCCNCDYIVFRQHFPLSLEFMSFRFAYFSSFIQIARRIDIFLWRRRSLSAAYKNPRSRSYFPISSSIVLPSWSAWKRP